MLQGSNHLKTRGLQLTWLNVSSTFKEGNAKTDLKAATLLLKTANYRTWKVEWCQFNGTSGQANAFTRAVDVSSGQGSCRHVRFCCFAPNPCFLCVICDTSNTHTETLHQPGAGGLYILFWCASPWFHSWCLFTFLRVVDVVHALPAVMSHDVKQSSAVLRPHEDFVFQLLCNMNVNSVVCHSELQDECRESSQHVTGGVSCSRCGPLPVPFHSTACPNVLILSCLGSFRSPGGKYQEEPSLPCATEWRHRLWQTACERFPCRIWRLAGWPSGALRTRRRSRSASVSTLQREDVCWDVACSNISLASTWSAIFCTCPVDRETQVRELHFEQLARSLQRSKSVSEIHPECFGRKDAVSLCIVLALCVCVFVCVCADVCSLVEVSEKLSLTRVRCELAFSLTRYFWLLLTVVSSQLNAERISVDVSSNIAPENCKRCVVSSTQQTQRLHEPTSQIRQRGAHLARQLDNLSLLLLPSSLVLDWELHGDSNIFESEWGPRKTQSTGPWHLYGWSPTFAAACDPEWKITLDLCCLGRTNGPDHTVEQLTGDQLWKLLLFGAFTGTSSFVKRRSCKTWASGSASQVAASGRRTSAAALCFCRSNE